MNTQTFRAPDMMAALETIQNKLGPNAVVLSVREVFDESCWKIWKRPGVEVLATVDQDLPSQKSVEKLEKPLTDQIKPSLQRPVPDLNAENGAKLYDRYLNQPQNQQRKPRNQSSTVMRKIREELSLQDVITPFRDQLVNTCLEVLPPQILQDRFRVENYIQELIEAEIEILPEVKVGRSRAICLIGSGGSGKTSITAKLAAAYQRKGNQQVAWISTDTVRAGAIAETRAYTDNLQIPFYKAYSPDEFGQLVQDLGKNNVMLIDFFDCNPHRKADVQQLDAYLKQVQQRDTYLVLSANTKVKDLISAVEAFQPLQLNGLIPTKLDETESYGNLISAIWKSRLPIVYTTAGSKITDPLQKPDLRFLVEKIFKKQEEYL